MIEFTNADTDLRISIVKDEICRIAENNSGTTIRTVDKEDIRVSENYDRVMAAYHEYDQDEDD